MRTHSGQAVLLSDYTPPSFKILDLHLDIRLDPEETVIISTMQIEPIEGEGQTNILILDGDELKLDFVSINKCDLSPRAYSVNADSLTIPNVPQERFELQITTRVDPTTNTKLMGLYLTSGIYCTQCEAEGFRRITYFLDRPDVMTQYTTRIEATRRETDFLLSNGNLVERATIPGTDRHYAIWKDPHPKPSYLFALVAGKLGHVADTFTTMTGREITLEIYVEPGKEHLCTWAMTALKKCMKWDEDVFGREYDLDIFMIVAVSDFNMGAMENKGLNVFNDKYVLADVSSATDQDFANIEAIIAHEYFHNWTGNRITCRDWFQLCLKEGLTVFRDQEFTSDMRSRAVKRITDVRMLRSRQFPEDAGPLAHPVRPETYQEINNFYTATVYEKGAELVRMIKTIAGDKAFNDGIQLYFDRHDGEAATIEDFLKSMEDGGKIDLSLFKRWYEQAGTPRVVVEQAYDVKTKTYTLTFNQVTLPTPTQSYKQPLHIPIRFGLLGSNGSDMSYESVEGGVVKDDVIHLKEAYHEIVFKGVEERPVPSLLREFSAPVRLDLQIDENDLIHLIAHDSDSFNRWQAMQTIAMRVLLNKIDCLQKDQAPDDSYACFFHGVESTITDNTLDPAFRAQFLTFPSEDDIAQHIGRDVDPTFVHEASVWLKRRLVETAGERLIDVYKQSQTDEIYQPDGSQVGLRSLKNACLSVLATHEKIGHPLARQQYNAADNLTDRLAALLALLHNEAQDASEVIADFDRRYRNQPLVMDKWFAVQATAPQDTTLTRIKELMKHPIFSITNPNRIRSLIGSFAAGNPTQFHRLDGAGYQFISTLVVDLDKVNPQVAARLLTSFSAWELLEPNRQEKAKRALKRIANSADLSRDVRDIVTRTLPRSARST